MRPVQNEGDCDIMLSFVLCAHGKILLKQVQTLQEELFNSKFLTAHIRYRVPAVLHAKR